jgi:hypothetical protein
MDFAPYQSSPPEHNRPFSPPTAADGALSPRASLDRTSRPFSPSQRNISSYSPPPLQHPQPQRAWQHHEYASEDGFGNVSAGVDVGMGMGMGMGMGVGGHEAGTFVSEFDTSLGLRLDYEAVLAYIGIPPLGAIVLLILERKSDYVR